MAVIGHSDVQVEQQAMHLIMVMGFQNFESLMPLDLELPLYICDPLFTFCLVFTKREQIDNLKSY